MKKLLNVILAVVMLLGVSFLAGCQVDFDGGTYSTPRISAKLLRETEGAESRDTGTFGTGHSVIMTEQATSNRQSKKWGLQE